MTEQKLRNSLKHVIYKATKAGVDGFSTATHMQEINRIVDEDMMQFITQYGDTRERLGRIDELENIAWVGPVKHVHERLAELKEEV